MLKQLMQHAFSLQPAQQWPTYDNKFLDRTEFLTSSEVASCLRQTFFSKVPGKSVYRGNGFTERGNAIEAWFVNVITALTPLGYTFEYMGKEQRSFYDPEIGISGTPDGLMTTPEGKKYLLEIKSIDPRFNKRNLPKKNHVYQLHQNMHLVQKCLNITLAGGILYYIDASNVFDINEYEYRFEQAMVDVCIKRAGRLWAADDAEELEPEGLQTGDCDTCPYTSECSATIVRQKALREVGAAAAPFSNAQLPREANYHDLTDKQKTDITAFLKVREKAAEYAKELESYKSLANEIVMEHDGLLIVGSYIITGRIQAGRETVDRALMERDGLDMNKYLKVGSPFIVLSVREPKKK